MIVVWCPCSAVFVVVICLHVCCIMVVYICRKVVQVWIWLVIAASLTAAVPFLFMW